MDLYLQCGNGFKALASHLNATFRCATYILSPRDLAEKGQIAFAKQIRQEGCQVLLDPQIYAPSSDKKNFQTYRYWPQGAKTGDERVIAELLDALGNLNVELGSRGFILPAYKLEHIARDVDDRAFRHVRYVADEAMKFKLPRYMTLCLTQNILLDSVQVDRLISFAEGWNVEGIYLVTEHPDSDYFVDNPMWMFQLMRLCAAFSLQGKKVIVGYANHQMLCLTCTGVEAIASGNWMNTRSFTFDKFKTDTGDIKRHKLWYYAPSMLTEYSVPYLDVAYSSKVLNCFDCRQFIPESPATKIFNSTVRPSLSGFKQADSFAHYLLALNKQRRECEADGTYRGRYRRQIEMLGAAKKKLSFLEKYRISGQNRDFRELISVNETALAMFDAELGLRMQMM